MTALHLVLGEGGPPLLLGAIVVAAGLTLVAAALEIALERVGGPDPAALPDWFAEHGPALFVFGGMPALTIVLLSTAGLALALGANPEETDYSAAVPLLLDLVLLIAVIGLGAGSPLIQHWGLGIIAFAAGVGAIFVLLFLAETLPFADNGSLGYPERLVFAIIVALIAAAVIAAAAALLAICVAGFRTYRALRIRRDAPPSGPAPNRLTLLGHRD